MCPLSLNLDGSKKERIYGEEVGEDPDNVDEDAVVDKEVDLKLNEYGFFTKILMWMLYVVIDRDLPPNLPHVQTIDVFLQYQSDHSIPSYTIIPNYAKSC